MLTEKQTSQKAIDIIKDAQKQINELYKDSPDISIRSNNTLQRLVNGFAHAAGIELEYETPSRDIGGGKLTHIAGIPLIQKETVAITAAEPSKQEEEEFDGFIDSAFEDFQTFEAADLRGNYNDLIIRAVAVKAGMEVSATEPATIDLPFIVLIKEAVAKKTEEIMFAAKEKSAASKKEKNK